jgi:hypothetical protein
MNVIYMRAKTTLKLYMACLYLLLLVEYGTIYPHFSHADICVSLAIFDRKLILVPVLRNIVHSEISHSVLSCTEYTNYNAVEPGYNDIGLCDTSSIAPDILWYKLISEF